MHVHQGHILLVAALSVNHAEQDSFVLKQSKLLLNPHVLFSMYYSVICCVVYD